jgi:hypothetical protein
LAPELEAMHKRAASGMKLGPPWKIRPPDGTEVTFGEPRGDERTTRQPLRRRLLHCARMPILQSPVS